MYVEGSLQNINRDGMTSRNYGIFNQRTVMIFDSTKLGRFALVAIGSLCMGSITITPSPATPNITDLVGQSYAQGDQLGYFQFGGSTVVLVTRKDVVRWDDYLWFASQDYVETLVTVKSRVALIVEGVPENAGLTPT
jgi:phosphatidylserine decarboxylase